MKAAIAAIGLMITSVTAHAADCKPQNDYDLSKLSLGVVSGGKVNFVSQQSEKPGCPSAAPACTKRAYLVDGNIVTLDGRTSGAYVCADFLGAHNYETQGWLPAASVKPTTLPPNWIGKWERDVNDATNSSEIVIKSKSKTTADVDGSATAGDGTNTNSGDMGATIDPTQITQGFADDYNGNQLPYDTKKDHGCAALMKQLGPALFVTDNNNCGGYNVTFSGRYLRK
jgi:hypothetical protein